MMGCVCGKEELEIGGRKFDVIKQIGEGGFSIVFLVQERGVSSKSGRFAVKKIACHSEREVERTKTEIQLHEKLGKHPHILSLETYSFEKSSSHQAVVYQRENSLSDSTDAFLVFPFYRRGTLMDELGKRQTREDPYTEKQVLTLFLGISKAIAAFHTTTPFPYAHGDIKVGNVLIDEDDSPVLMDFGSARPARISIETARAASTLQDEAAEHSTMTYRPPELFNVQVGDKLDERTDIWLIGEDSDHASSSRDEYCTSLGCLLYALCFFVSPFDSVHERGDSVALAAASGRISFPPDSPFSEELHSLIREMVEVEMKSRPRIEEVVKSTEELLQNLPQIPPAHVV